MMGSGAERDDVLSTATARSMMPGLATPAPGPTAEQRASVREMLAGLELDLMFGNLLSALQRVRRTDPGSGDLDFIRGVRGRRVETLTADERTRLQSLRWKYRVQLPEGLRRASPPG